MILDCFLTFEGEKKKMGKDVSANLKVNWNRWQVTLFSSLYILLLPAGALLCHCCTIDSKWLDISPYLFPSPPSHFHSFPLRKKKKEIGWCSLFRIKILWISSSFFRSIKRDRCLYSFLGLESSCERGLSIATKMRIHDK